MNYCPQHFRRAFTISVDLKGHSEWIPVVLVWGSILHVIVWTSDFHWKQAVNTVTIDGYKYWTTIPWIRRHPMRVTPGLVPPNTEPMLAKCQLKPKEKHSVTFYQNIHLFLRENTYGKVNCKITAIFIRPPSVKPQTVQSHKNGSIW